MIKLFSFKPAYVNSLHCRELCKGVFILKHNGYAVFVRRCQVSSSPQSLFHNIRIMHVLHVLYLLQPANTLSSSVRDDSPALS